MIFCSGKGLCVLADRLLDIQREFHLGLDLGCHGGVMAEELTGHPNVKQILQADISEAYARKAAHHRHPPDGCG